MFIESIKLKDWCQHSNVEWSEAESPVVGLLGENGKGKSNFLAALEYAFTGHVRGNANSYIRNGAKKAVVDVTFVKNGERGTIKRTINQNTTSRELKWANDDVITKDKEVRETLESIMGADTYGMQNAVFINQSELDSMLFGLQSEREALFVKLLLVSHLEKVGKVADGKMKRVAAGVQDFTQVKDEIDLQLKQARAELANHNSSLQYYPDMQPAIDAMVERIYDMGLLAKKEAEAAQYKVELRQKDENLREVLGTYGYETIEQANKERAELGNKQIEIMKLLADHNSNVANRDSLEVARVEHEKLKNEKVDLNEKIEIASRDLVDLADIEERIKTQEHRARLIEERDKLQTSLDDNMAEFQTHIAQPPSFSKEEANLRRERLAGLKVEYGIKTQKYELLVQALGVSGTEASVCPCCDQKVDGTQFSADAAEKLKIFLEEHKQTIASLEDDLRQIDAELNAYDARTTKLSENAGAFAAQKKTVELQLEDKKEEDIEYLKLVKDNALTAKATVDSYKTRLVTVEQDSKTYYDNLIQLEKKLIDVEFLSDEKVAELKKEQDELVARIEKGTQVSSVTAALQIDVGNVKSQLVHAKSELMDLDQKLSDIGPELKDVNLPYEQESVEKLKAQQVERNKIVALVEAAAKTVNEKELRLKEVEDKIAANQKKTDLIKSLKKVKEAFSRTGIPLAYVNHRFKQVLALAQDNLVSLDANFSVEPDPDNAVSFLFTRNDSDDTTAMPMSRLSGGQKVRLTVAFLMAVQQLIIPDVGLLILDEPSVHLDEEGVNSLCEMLISLSRKLRNTECQVWVCDHNTILEAAFSSFMRLK